MYRAIGKVDGCLLAYLMVNNSDNLIKMNTIVLWLSDVGRSQWNQWGDMDRSLVTKNLQRRA